MDEINRLYDNAVANPHGAGSIDIYEHLPTLLRYAEECEHVTEMGVRDGISTLALIKANPKKLVSYDIRSTPKLEHIMRNSIPTHSLVIGDCLELDIEETDMLFIDTLHTYNQLAAELNKHAANVRKYIIFHDTVTFGRIDEGVYDHASNHIKGKFTNKQGLQTALDDFLVVHTEWSTHEVFTNNNGLTIIKRNE